MDPAVLTELFAAAYNGNLAVVKSIVKDKRVAVDTVDPVQVCEKNKHFGVGGWIRLIR